MKHGESHVLKRSKAVSRRRFLGLAAVAAGASLIESASGGNRKPRLHVPIGGRRSQVVKAQSAHVVAGPIVHQDILAEMLDASLISLARAETVAQAWRTFVRPDDVIGLKFNRSGQEEMGTTSTFATVLVRSLVDAGFSAKRIVCIEAPAGTDSLQGTKPAWIGFDTTAVDFGSGRDQLASVLRQITAIINVPYLKTHNLATVTCALKNLSHGLVKHPARYHRNGCSPYVADIVALDEIQKKLRLCLVDALHVVYDGGPTVASDALSVEGVLLASSDPVAVDTVGLSLINDIRARNGLEPIAESVEEVAYLTTAHRQGLGVALPHAIDLVQVAS